jgi:hypothetical protein
VKTDPQGSGSETFSDPDPKIDNLFPEPGQMSAIEFDTVRKSKK